VGGVSSIARNRDSSIDETPQFSYEPGAKVRLDSFIVVTP